MRLLRSPLLWSVCLFFCLLLWAGFATGQSLQETLTELSAAMQEVSDDKTTYIQSFSFEADKPYRVAFVCRDITMKDRKEKEHRYELNLADLDKNLVRRVTTSKMLAVSVGARRSVKAIKYFQDGTQQSYQSDFQIRAKDSEHMEQIERLLRAAIPLAEGLWESSLEIDLGSLPEMTAWLSKKVGKVAVGEDMYTQSLSGAGREDLVQLSVEAVTTKGRNVSNFKFSLGDLQEQRISYKILGSKIVVEAKTQQNRNMVTVEQDGAPQNYAGSVEIFCNDLDEAKQLTLVLQKAAPLAATSLAAIAPQPGSLEEAFTLIAQHIGNTNDGKRDIAQAFEGACPATLATTIADEKKQEQYRYIFDFSDMDERKVELAIKGRSISLHLSTANNNSYIQIYKDGELYKYANTLSIEVPDIETVRLLEPGLRYVIQGCETKTATEDFAWIARRVAAFRGVGDVAQTLAQETSNACKFSLSINTSTKKGAQEELYEFNLKDMDPRQVELNVSGKDVSVVLQTKGKQKLINYYKDGKPVYVDKVAFGVADVAEGKVFRATFGALTEGCQ